MTKLIDDASITIKNLKNAHHRKLEEICEKMLQTQYETLSEDSGCFALPISEKQNTLFFDYSL